MVGCSYWLTTAKVLYYRVVAWMYGLAGACADVAMVNSSWTQAHINRIWRIPNRTFLVYPPCDTLSLQVHTCCGSSSSIIILIIAQLQFVSSSSSSPQFCSFTSSLLGYVKSGSKVGYLQHLPLFHFGILFEMLGSVGGMRSKGL